MQQTRRLIQLGGVGTVKAVYAQGQLDSTRALTDSV